MKKKLGLLVICLCFFVLFCACKKESGGMVREGARASYRPNTPEELLDVCIKALFFENDVETVKQFAPPFNSVAEEQAYWRELNSVVELIHDCGLVMDGYEVFDTNVHETDAMKTYCFGPPFVEYNVNTEVIYELILFGDINLNRINLNSGNDALSELYEDIREAEEYGEDTSYESCYFNIIFSERDGIWYFAVDEYELDDWKTDFVDF